MSKIVANRYKKTTVRKKRNVIRALNTFTQQYNVACLKYIDNMDANKEVHIDINDSNPLNIYFDSMCDNCLEFFKDNKVSGVIWDLDVERDDLSNYVLLTQLTDNLLSINKKKNYKDSLKKIIRKMTLNNIDKEETWLTFFFEERFEEEVIANIEYELKNYDEIKVHNKPKPYISDSINEKLHIESKTYKTLARKIYTQLKNRVKFRHAGVYLNNDDVSNKSNILIPKFITSYDKLMNRINYLLKREWLLNKDIVDSIKMKLLENDIKEKKLNLTEQISEYYGIRVYMFEGIVDDYEDVLYMDLIEVLKFYYLESENNIAKYPNPNYEPYEYNLVMSTSAHWEEEDAVNQIKQYNKNLFSDEQDSDLKVEKEREHYTQRYEHPIEEEIYYDTSLKDECRQTAASINMQWNTYYDFLLDGIISKDISNNQYYVLHVSAVELTKEYKILIDNNVFLPSGRINERSKYLQSFKKKLLTQFKDLERKKSNKVIAQILNIKKKEWRLFYTSMNSSNCINSFSNFNYKII